MDFSAFLLLPAVVTQDSSFCSSLRPLRFNVLAALSRDFSFCSLCSLRLGGFAAEQVSSRKVSR